MGVHPAACSQSASGTSASVMVPTRRTTCVCAPVAAGVIKHATTVRVWRSRPQHRSNPTSIVASRGRRSPGGVLVSSVCGACFPAGSDTQWCLGTPRSKVSAGSQHQAPADLILATVDHAGSVPDRRCHPPVVPHRGMRKLQEPEGLTGAMATPFLCGLRRQSGIALLRRWSSKTVSGVTYQAAEGFF
jgi:hypothetical protein